MKLNDYLYRICGKESAGDAATYSIALLPSCPIYSAHFPGMPVTPGVCQIQMVRELAEDFVNKPLMTTGVKNAKFISVLIPGEDGIKVTLSKVQQEGNRIKVQAVIAGDDTVYAKLSLQTVIA